MGEQGQEKGRIKQKRRTRNALLKAADELMAGGNAPTVAEAAEAADVSTRTAYRYFPSQELLLTEAMLETLRPEVEESIEREAGPDDVEARVDALICVVHRLTLANEVLLRTMIRLTVGKRSATSGDEREDPRRGVRRVDWIEAALAPVRDRMEAVAFHRLVSALALCTGIESLLVLRDVRGHSEPETLEVSRWVARALVRASLD